MTSIQKPAPTNLREAVNAKCTQCESMSRFWGVAVEDADPGLTKRIGTCTVTDCALWAVRPYQDAAQ